MGLFVLTTSPLTTGTDNIVGTANADTFTGNAGGLTSGDTIDGGAGVDTFNLTLTGANPAMTLKNVEILNVTASPNPASIDLTGVAGLTDINNKSSANGATVTV